ncbi:MAG: sarcosine oxidase subunit delta [Pseudomonadota bacterium]
MLRIPCPFCGLRDHAEFDYAGDATIAYPELGAPQERWCEAVYLRDDPKGPHVELWRHARGCGSWLIVERDTLTHEIKGARFAHPGDAIAMGPPPPSPPAEPLAPSDEPEQPAPAPEVAPEAASEAERKA